MKRILTLLLMLCMVLSMTACSGKNEDVVKPAETEETGDSAEEPTETEPAAESGKVYEIAVLVKGLDSDYWQQLIVGAKNYEFDNADKVKVTIYGPTSEADVAEQTEILDDIITKHPDGIALVSTLTDNCNAGVETAMSANIPVVTMDNQITTDAYITHYAT